MKQLALPLIALVGFSSYTLYVMLQAEQSLLQFGLQLMTRADTAQVVIDLYLLATLACVWMYSDAKARDKSLAYLLPYLALTVVFVSVGPLLYLVLRALSKDRPAPVSSATTTETL
ncbi:uncharacterized protein DUF2834 [Pseudomonas sp. SJZ079]|uniref:DUF2834 domain-containing protein n=1 Tax=Pseudomonas sp. SJZ079 TaxID=2572887 RepID=UPI00119B7CF7|nr:DUF2834 domain-containing protein [Pseudomonas sp. SJZ079]TWC33265.1 uncharacterized protein DUF2834 [Pseudomonas sp. SJZ079]